MKNAFLYNKTTIKNIPGSVHIVAASHVRNGPGLITFGQEWADVVTGSENKNLRPNS